MYAVARLKDVRRLFKYLPVSIEMQTAIGLDEQAEAGKDQHNEALIIEGEYENVDTPEIFDDTAETAETVNTETGEVTQSDGKLPL